MKRREKYEEEQIVYVLITIRTRTEGEIVKAIHDLTGKGNEKAKGKMKGGDTGESALVFIVRCLNIDMNRTGETLPMINPLWYKKEDEEMVVEKA